ncbi:MAG: nucleoside recognition protein [Clostridiales bacterium]|jgi:spore maturation protein A|nr:nucleoside recognition protein [Clostridiales bacterium]
MLNYIWGGMILVGLTVGAFNGRMQDITNTVVDSSKEAVMLCVTMLGIMSMWTGVMKIAERAGLIDTLSLKLKPLLRLLFPGIPREHLALKYISINFIANVLGLGWAATPAGLKAMEELQKLNTRKDTASNSMCMFLIINMSSLQLVTMNILAYRSQYQSANPSEIIGPGLLATVFSTIAGVAACKIFEKRRGE